MVPGDVQGALPFPPMAAAAFVVSVVALAVAILGALYARRSAAAAEKSATADNATAELDRQRRHDELTPDFEVRLDATPARSYNVGFVLRHPSGLASVTVTILDQPNGSLGALTSFVTQRMSDTVLSGTNKADLAAMSKNAAPVTKEASYEGAQVAYGVDLRFDCRAADGHTWTVNKHINVPEMNPDVLDTIY
jgi:hypothetical protein